MSNKVIGVDIGNKNLKLSVVEKNNNKNIIKSKEMYDSKDFIKDNFITNKDVFLNILQDYANKNNIKHPNYIVSISNSKNCSLTRIFNIAKVKSNELKNAIDIEIEDIIPLDKSQYTYSWHIIDTKDNEHKILLATLDKGIYNHYVDVFSELDVSLTIIPNTISLINCFNGLNIKDVSLVVDIGHTHTEIIALSGNKPLLIRSINYGGKIISDLISKQYNINDIDADKFKKEFLSLNPKTNREKEVYNLISSQMNLIVQEIKTTLLIMKNEYNTEVNTIFLTGGVSNTVSITDYIQSATNVKTQLLVPSYSTEEDIIFNSSIENSLYNNKNKINMSFYTKTVEDKTVKFIPLFVNAVCIGLLIFLFFFNKINYDNNINKTKKLQEQLNTNKTLLSNLNTEYSQLDKQEQISKGYESIEKNKIEYTTYLKELRTIIPNNLQIDTMEINQKEVTIKGVSPDYSSMAFYVKELRYDNNFSNCNFTYNDKEKVVNNLKVKVVEFEIHLSIK